LQHNGLTNISRFRKKLNMIAVPNAGAIALSPSRSASLVMRFALAFLIV
jgi:hypothetical protein